MASSLVPTRSSRQFYDLPAGYKCTSNLAGSSAIKQIISRNMAAEEASNKGSDNRECPSDFELHVTHTLDNVWSRRFPIALIGTGLGCMLILSLIMAPYLGTLSGLNERFRTDVRIAVIDLDVNSTGPVRIAPVLQKYLTAVKAANGPNSPPLPAFDFSTGITTVEELVDQLEHGKLWAGYIVNAGAGAALSAALAAAANTTSNSTVTYNPANAISFYYDEAWSQTLTGRATAPARTLLAKFGPVFAQGLAHQLATQQVGGSAFVGALAVNQPALLASPVSYTEFNLHPTWRIPVGLHIITAAVLMAIVASLAATNLSFRYLALPEYKSVRSASAGWLTLSDGLNAPRTPFALVHARALSMFFGAMFVGIAFASISVGMAGDGYEGGAQGWAQIFAAIWLTSLTITWFMGGTLEITGVDYQAIVFIPIAYYNALAGWNVAQNISPSGYEFFWFAPAYHAVCLLRNILFGTRATQVGMNVGVLFGWAVFGIIFYYVVALWAKPALVGALRSRGKIGRGTSTDFGGESIEVETAEKASKVDGEESRRSVVVKIETGDAAV